MHVVGLITDYYFIRIQFSKKSFQKIETLASYAQKRNFKMQVYSPLSVISQLQCVNRRVPGVRFLSFKYLLLFSFDGCVHPVKPRLNDQI